MADCPKCGAQVGDDARFCPACGEALHPGEEKTAAPQEPAGGTAQPGQQPQAPVYQPPRQQAYAAPVYEQPRMSPDAEENRYLCVFAYFCILLIIPAVLKPTSEFVRFHVNQGLALMLFEMMCAVVCIVPILGWIAGGLGLIFAFVCVIIGIVHSCNGEETALPWIGKWRILR